MLKKKILVVSHERSGTHFLINTIAQNFGYLCNQIDLDNTQGVNWRNAEIAETWLRQFQGRYIPNIFKSHHTFPFIEPLLPGLQGEFHIFYIRRDGRDVMTSFWAYINRLAPGWGPRTRTVGEFMRASPCGGLMQYQHKQSPTMLQRWVDHIASWNQRAGVVTIISYEELHLEFSKTLIGISDVLGQELSTVRRPTLMSQSSLPWKGEVGNWKKYFTTADEQYFMKHANITCK